MVQKKHPERMTDEQRRRIMETPGVVVHRRQGPAPARLPEPKLRVAYPISASELTNDDEDEFEYEPCE